MIDRPSQRPLSSNSGTPVFVSLICTILVLFFGDTHLPDGGSILAATFIEDYADQSLFSDQDILVKAGRVIPFIFYRLLSVLLSCGAEPESIFFWGLIVILPLIFYLMWHIAELISGSEQIASVTTIGFGMMPATTGCVMYTPFPYYSFVSASFVMPLLLYALLVVLRGVPELGLIPAALTFVFHPGFGIMTATVVCVAVACELSNINHRRLVILSIISICISIPFFLIIQQTQGATSELYFYLLKRISFHTYVELFWPDQVLKTTLLTGLIFFVQPAVGKDTVRRFRMVSVVVFLLFLTYIIGLYILESRSVIRMYLWRSSAFLKPISFTLFFIILFDQLSKPYSSGRWIKVFVLLIGLAHDSYQHSYDGGLILAFGFILITFKRVWVLTASAAVFFYLVLWSPWKSSDPLYFAVLLFSPFLVFLASKQNCDNFSSDSSYKYLLSCASVLLCVTFKSILSDFSPRLTEPFEYYQRESTVELAQWAKVSSQPKSIFIVDPRNSQFLGFRVMARRSIFYSNIDLGQLTYAPGEMEREMYNRGLELGLLITPESHIFKRYSISFDNFPCNAIKVARKYVWIDYIVFSTEQDPVREQFSPVFENADFVVYKAEDLRSNISIRVC